MNYRKKEPWMQKGATVQLSNNTGIIVNILTVTPGPSLDIATKEPIVLSLLIKPTGVKHEFTFNPNSVDQLKSKEPIPFPDVMG